MDIGVHMVDLALWLMGNPRPVSAMGVTYSEFGPRQRGLGGWGSDAPPPGSIPADARYDVDDLASGMVRFDNGATLVVDVTWAGFTPNEERVQILGTEGGAEVYTAERQPLTQTPLKLYHDLGGRSTESFPILPPASPLESAQWLQLATLVNAIRGGGPLRVTPEQALTVTAILVALQESAALGRSVEVNVPA
jgi:predicted dehydrogenase